MLFVVVVLTINSAVFNVLTRRRAAPPAGLTFVRTGDIDTRIRTWGTTGTPIVLVPGAFETADTFDAVARDLATDHRSTPSTSPAPATARRSPRTTSTTTPTRCSGSSPPRA